MSIPANDSPDGAEERTETSEKSPIDASLIDENGVVVSDITVSCGVGPVRWGIDFATHPDALLHFYFDQRSGPIILLSGTRRQPVQLKTRWQRGGRRWFLHAVAGSAGPD